MRHRYLLPCLLVVGFALAPLLRADTPRGPRALRSGVIEYELTTTGAGTTSSGTRTEWFDDFGNKQATLEKSASTTKVFGLTSSENKETLTIVDGATGYTIDLLEKTGTKQDVAKLQLLGAALAWDYQRKHPGMTLRQFVEENQGRWLPAETVLGRTCDVYELLGTKIWQYQDVVLRSEANLLGVQTRQIATKFQENVDIPAARFAVPAGIRIEAAPDLAALMAEGMRANGAPEKEEADAEPSAPVTLTREQFDRATAGVRLEGFIPGPAFSAAGSHMLTLIGADERGFSLSALPLVDGAKLALIPGATVARFQHRGHAAFFVRATDEEGEPMSALVVEYPEHRMALMIAGRPATDRAPLDQLLGQVAL